MTCSFFVHLTVPLLYSASFLFGTDVVHKLFVVVRGATRCTHSQRSFFYPVIFEAPAPPPRAMSRDIMSPACCTSVGDGQGSSYACVVAPEDIMTSGLLSGARHQHWVQRGSGPAELLPFRGIQAFAALDVYDMVVACFHNTRLKFSPHNTARSESKSAIVPH